MCAHYLATGARHCLRIDKSCDGKGCEGSGPDWARGGTFGPLERFNLSTGSDPPPPPWDPPPSLPPSAPSLPPPAPSLPPSAKAAPPPPHTHLLPRLLYLSSSLLCNAMHRQQRVKKFSNELVKNATCLLIQELATCRMPQPVVVCLITLAGEHPLALCTCTMAI